MARFILDIASNDLQGIMSDQNIKMICTEICDFLLEQNNTSGIISINCIDPSNENQFNDELDIENGTKSNNLTENQIQAFNNTCNS